jgi:hypothetical protein
MFSPISGASPGQSTTDMRHDTKFNRGLHDDTNPAVDGLDFHHQCGTKSHPYIILADPSHPEHKFPFDITPIEKLSITTMTTMESWNYRGV